MALDTLSISHSFTPSGLADMEYAPHFPAVSLFDTWLHVRHIL
jgi:hypothetical protein